MARTQLHPMARSPRSVAALWAIAAVAFCVTPARAADGGDLVIEVPEVVKAAVKAEAAGDKIVEFRRDTDDAGAVGYVVTASGRQGEYLMRFDATGALTRKWVEPVAPEADADKAIAYESLPKNVKEALVDQLHGGVVKGITLHEEKPTYEVRAKINGKFYSIRLEANGKFIEKVVSDQQEEAAQ